MNEPPRTIQLTVPDGTLPVYEAEPPGVPRGAVVVLQEAFGVNDHIQDVTRRFAAAGFRAAAPHLFHRTGDPTFGYDGGLDGIRPHMGALTAEGLGYDLDATLTHLGDAGFRPDRVGAVGFCMGGTVALVAGTRHALGAAVSFYGGGITEGRFGEPPLVELAPGLRSPWLGLYGDQDTGIPTEEVEALRTAAATAEVPTEVVRYPDAGHGFHCDARASYDPPAAADGWARTLAWLDAYLAPVP
jgi:carboxymethylenebutenolidase